MSDTFSRYHPVVNFLFFALVLVFSMVLIDRKSTRLNSSHM